MTVRPFLLLAFLAALSARAGVPRSLVARMMDAREGFVPPAREMRLEADSGQAGVAWPFDVARIEKLLEKRMDRAEDGAYLLKGESDEPGGGGLRARADAAMAYANRVFSEWAVMSMDVRYPRCDAETVRALAGYRVDMDRDFWSKFAISTKTGMHGGGAAKVTGWIAGWKLTDRVYLLLTNEFSSPTRPCDYQFVMWDGRKDWPVAGFDVFPDAFRARTVLAVLDSPVAANNLAVLLHSRDANRKAYMPDYLESLLRRAAAGGCEAAFYNLGVLMEARGDREQAAAFFSRGGAGTKE